MKTTPARGSVPLIVLPIVFVIAAAALGYVLVRNGVINIAGLTPQTAKTATTTTSSNGKVKLVWAVQWAEDVQQHGVYENGVLKVKGLQQYLDEYNASHPNVEVTYQILEYDQMFNKFKVLSAAGMPPDIYQAYSNWAVSYVKDGLIDKPPADIVADVKNNFVSPAGATINGEIWGIPEETDDYCLLYNKDLFKAAGIATAPKTWNELVADAAKLTKKDAKGAISQYGIAFLIDNDWQVVDPYLSLLFSNGGQYISSDNKTALFNSPAGVAALEAELQLFKQGSTDINGNFYDFGKGKVAMVIAPPWNKTTFKGNFGARFEEAVGVAPIPYMVKPASLQYSWFIGVSAKSQHKQEAWDFLRWLTSTLRPPVIGTTALGDLMATNIGAIPARKVDFNSHKDVLGDFYTKTFIDQMKYSVAEPNVAQATDLKAILMKQIQAAWSGQKTAKQALDDAAASINAILAQNYK